MKKSHILSLTLLVGAGMNLAGCDGLERAWQSQSEGTANQSPDENVDNVHEASEQTNAGTRTSQDPILQRLRAKPLSYTRHGECRMECRHISGDEVREILDHGTVSHDRTRNDGRCASYAVEGTTSDDQEVRIVYADCARETRLITAIDLGREWECDCR